MCIRDRFITLPGVIQQVEAVLEANTDSSVINPNYIGGQPAKLDLPASFIIEDDNAALTITTDDLSGLPQELTMAEDGRIRLNKDELVNIFIIVKYYVE